MDEPRFAIADTGTRTRLALHVVIVVIGGFLGAIATSTVGYLVFSSLGYDVVEPAPELRAVLAAIEYTGFVLFGLWYVDWADERDILHLRLPTLRDVGWAVLGFFVLLGGFVLLSVLFDLLDVSTATNQAIEAGEEQPRLLIYLAVVSIFFTAPAEEFLYRGLVQGLFRRAYGVVPGIVAASVVFGVVHAPALVVGSGSIEAYLLVAAVLGIVLGAAYEYSGNLVVPVVIHGVFNTYQFLAVYADTTSVVGTAV